jgi:hypothetical protein
MQLGHGRYALMSTKIDTRLLLHYHTIARLVADFPGIDRESVVRMITGAQTAQDRQRCSWQMYDLRRQAYAQWRARQLIDELLASGELVEEDGKLTNPAEPCPYNDLTLESTAGIETFYRRRLHERVGERVRVLARDVHSDYIVLVLGRGQSTGRDPRAWEILDGTLVGTGVIGRHGVALIEVEPGKVVHAYRVLDSKSRLSDKDLVQVMVARMQAWENSIYFDHEAARETALAEVAALNAAA